MQVSKIIATNNLDTHNWHVETSDISSTSYLEFKFVRNNQQTPIEFQNLQFGFKLYKEEDENFIYSEGFPKGPQYISTDQSVIHTVTLNLQQETTYRVDLWRINNGIESSSKFSFLTGRPKSPYPSWTWNGTTWEAPVPAPEGMYEWNEETLVWKEINQ
jgi:hypothetical protein